MIDEKLFATEIVIPDEFESMFNVSLNHSKLKDIMRFVMQMLQRHEKGIKLALDKIKPIAPDLLEITESLSKIDSDFKSNDSKINQALDSFKTFEEELSKKIDSSESLKYALELTINHDSAISLQQKEIDHLRASNQSHLKSLNELEKSLKKLKNSFEKIQVKKVEEARRISKISERVLDTNEENKFIEKNRYGPGVEDDKDKSKDNEGFDGVKGGLGIGEKIQKEQDNIACFGKAVESGFKFGVVGHKIDEKTAGIEGLKKFEDKIVRNVDKVRVFEEKMGEKFLRQDEKRNKTEEKNFKKGSHPQIYEGLFPYPNKIYTEVEKFSSPTASNASEIKTPHKSQVILPSRVKNIEHRLEIVEKILTESEPAVLFNKLEHTEKTFRFYESVLDKLEPEILKNRLNIKKLTEKYIKIEKELIQKTSVDHFDPIRNLVLTLASGSSRKNLIAVPSTQDSNLSENLNSRLTELENFYLTSKVSSINFEELSYQLLRIEQKLDFKSDSTEMDLIKQSLYGLAEQVRVFLESGDRPLVQKSEQGQLSGVNRKILQLEAQFKSLGLPPNLSFQSISEEIHKMRDSIKFLLSSLDAYSSTFNSKFNELALTGFAPNIEKIKKTIEFDLKEQMSKLIENNEKKFADKFEMLRGFKYVEGHLNKLEKIMRKSDAEEVILARKPLGGWTCGSCDKVVEKLSGKGGGYTPWNKLPVRDPKDRIIKAGTGYSNMILQLEPINKRKNEESALTERSVTPTPFI